MTAPLYPIEAARLAEITRNATGQLVLSATGLQVPIEAIRIRKCFPWSLPGQYISITDKDGKEIVLLKSLDGLPAALRQVIADELHLALFDPRVHRILDQKNELGVLSLTAETDRGQVTFQVRTRDDVRFISPTKMLLRDADGNTYEIPDLDALDPTSKRCLYEYM